MSITGVLLSGQHAIAQTGKSVVVGNLVDRPNAIMILNPPHGNQGMLVPQLTTQQRVAMHPISPEEDGLLLFDITEKTFYFWKGNNWVKGLGTEATQDLGLAGNTLILSNDATPVNLNNLTASGQVNGALDNLAIAPNSIAGNHIQNGTISITKMTTAGATDANKVFTTSLTGLPQLQSKVSLFSGLPASGDLSGAYPAPNVAKLQGNAVAPVSLATADVGKILVWNGTQWMPQIVSTVSPASQYVMIDPAEFTNLRRSDRKDKDNIIVFDDNSAYVTTIKKDEGPQIIAPLQLPHGATIEEVTLYYMDRESRNIVFDVLRKSPTGANQPVISSWTSSGSSAAIRSSVHTPLPGSQIVDNNLFSYRVVINLDQTNDVNDSNDANLRVYAVKVKYLP